MLFKLVKNRTSSTIVTMYSLYLYFLGLSLHNKSKALIIFRERYKKRSYVYVCNCIQRFDSSSQIYRRRRIPTFIMDEAINHRLLTTAFGYGLQLDLT
jgi:hypothetical protein